MQALQIPRGRIMLHSHQWEGGCKEYRHLVEGIATMALVTVQSLVVCSVNIDLSCLAHRLLKSVQDFNNF